MIYGSFHSSTVFSMEQKSPTVLQGCLTKNQEHVCTTTNTHHFLSTSAIVASNSLYCQPAWFPDFLGLQLFSSMLRMPWTSMDVPIRSGMGQIRWTHPKAWVMPEDRKNCNLLEPGNKVKVRGRKVSTLGHHQLPEIQVKLCFLKRFRWNSAHPNKTLQRLSFGAVEQKRGTVR